MGYADNEIPETFLTERESEALGLVSKRLGQPKWLLMSWYLYKYFESPVHSEPPANVYGSLPRFLWTKLQELKTHRRRACSRVVAEAVRLGLRSDCPELYESSDPEEIFSGGEGRWHFLWKGVRSSSYASRREAEFAYLKYRRETEDDEST